MYRLINKNEIKKAAKLMADAFIDYPLYDVLFPNVKKKEKGIFYFCWYRIYARKSYTKISSDFKELYCLKTPNDKESKALALFFNPKFLFPFIHSLSFFTLKRLIAFKKLERKYQRQFYQSKTDNYLQVICVDKASDGGIKSFTNLLKHFNEFLNSTPTYFETHTYQHEKLYQSFGALTLAKEDFYGCTHIVMMNKSK